MRAVAEEITGALWLTAIWMGVAFALSWMLA